MRGPALIIVADDYGYAPAYDRGILEAAAAGALDVVGAMVMRDRCDPGPLVATRVAVGLHLELPGLAGERATKGERDAAAASARVQLARFRELFGAAPARLDGHHHCHAQPGLAAVFARLARELELPVRSVDARHRRLLRCHGVATPDRLVGRLRETDPVVPAEVEAFLRGEPPPGVTEWMTHPGHPGGRSAYDAGREEDLRAVLELSEPLRRWRPTRDCRVFGGMHP